MIDLGAYLKDQIARPWVWGSMDCTTFPAGWVQICSGIDPMTKWRGYDSEVDAEMLIAQAGGLVALWDEGLAGIWPRHDADPRVGDIGIIPVLDGAGEPIEIGAIFTGKRWAFRSPRGVGAISIAYSDVVATWGK